MIKIAVLASGEGSNFEALVQATRSGVLDGQICGLITNRGKIPALERAERLGIPAKALIPKRFSTREEWDQEVLKTLQAWGANWVALAGFLTLIGPRVLHAFADRVVNIHPALLPDFGGEGMYGQRVHEAVIAARSTKSGITVHLVSAEYDRGRILAQFPVKIAPEDTAETLAARIRELEHKYYPRVLNDLVHGRIITD